MDDELARLEAQRAQLNDIVQRRQRHTSVVMYLAFVIVGVVFIMLIGALLAGQLSVLGLFLSALVIGLLLFVLSRKMRSGIRTGMVADLVFGGSAMTDMEYLQAQIADYDKQIASLKRAGKA